jgi:hypothetical protein
MKRTVETNVGPGHRQKKNRSDSLCRVLPSKTSIYEPEQLKNVAIGVSLFNGSHFTMLKMIEGFVKRDEIKWTSCGTHRERLMA